VSDINSAVEIVSDRVILRDPRPEDVEARLRWVTVEVAWQDWDAPWEGKALTPPERVEEARISLREKIAQPLPTPRVQLWIQAIDGPLLGWVNHYYHDLAARSVSAGINICESAYRGRGLGTEAFRLWIGYVFANLEVEEVRTATWSGNVRMVRLAEKCGFTLVTREMDKREVQGRRYDGLGFSLCRQAWMTSQGKSDER